MKNNNSGFSLAELLVAIGIGAVVSTAIASLIVLSLRMYSKESVNAGMQYELQTTLNEFVDAIQSSEGLIIQNAVSPTLPSGSNQYTSYVMLGHFDVNNATAGTYDFYGDIFYVDQTAGYDPLATGKFDIYKLHIPEADKITATMGAGLVTAAASVGGGMAADKKHLLSKDCTKFLLNVGSDILDDSVSPKVFTNPISLDIHLTFEKSPRGVNISAIKRNVDDQARMRNRVKVPIVVGDETGTTTYIMKKE